MYKCNECGRLFEEPETWRENRGEFWGVMSYETLSGCPACYSGDYDEYTGEEDQEEGENDDDG